MRILVIVSIFITLLFSNAKLDKLINDIKQAKGDDRRVKMNKLKLFLRKLNQEKREKAIYKLKASMGAMHHSMQNDKAKNVPKSMDMSKHIEMMKNMHQHINNNMKMNHNKTPMNNPKNTPNQPPNQPPSQPPNQHPNNPPMHQGGNR